MTKLQNDMRDRNNMDYVQGDFRELTSDDTRHIDNHTLKDEK